MSSESVRIAEMNAHIWFGGLHEFGKFEVKPLSIFEKAVGVVTVEFIPEFIGGGVEFFWGLVRIL